MTFEKPWQCSLDETLQRIIALKIEDPPRVSILGIGNELRGDDAAGMAIVCALKRPLQGAEIKRRALLRDPTLKMSANNVRDALRLMLKKKIVCRISIKRKAHPRYMLTFMGQQFRFILQRLGPGLV